MNRLAVILHLPLSEIGGQAIRPVRLIILTLILLITFFAARAKRRQMERWLSQYAVWAIGLIVALNLVSVDLTAFAVVAGALGLGVGFALQNVVANFVAGLAESPLAPCALPCLVCATGKACQRSETQKPACPRPDPTVASRLFSPPPARVPFVCSQTGPPGAGPGKPASGIP